MFCNCISINTPIFDLNVLFYLFFFSRKHLTHEERERLSIERAKKESERLKMESKKSYKLLELEPPAKKCFKLKVTSVKGVEIFVL